MNKIQVIMLMMVLGLVKVLEVMVSLSFDPEVKIKGLSIDSFELS